MDQHVESPAPATSSYNIEKLPNELLDLILALLGPRSHNNSTKRSTSRHEQDKQSWLNFSLVCRRWHQIALPWVFRWLNITAVHSLDIDITPEEFSSITRKFAGFLSSTPHVAMLIEEMKLCWVPVEPSTLAAVLDLLPRLRHLILVRVLAKDGAVTTQVPQQYRLESLTYDVGPECTPITYLPNILSLFSEVEELKIANCSRYLPDELKEFAMTRSTSRDGATLRIRRLVVGGSAAHLELSNLLVAVHALSYITHLEIYLGNRSGRGFEGLGNLLLKVSGTLRDLHLHLRWCLDGPEHGDGQSPGRWERDGRGLEASLAACTTLHSLRLVIITDINMRKPSERAEAAFLQRRAEDGWLVGAEIISLVPAAQLRHLSYIYTFIESEKDAHIDVEARRFNWSAFRAACRRFRDLHETEVHLVGMHEESKALRAAHVRRELEDLRGVMTSGNEKCPEDGCRWRSVKSAVFFKGFGVDINYSGSV